VVIEQKVTSIEAGRPSSTVTDSGLIAFVLLLRLHSIPADPAQLRHLYLQGAEQLGVKNAPRSEASRVAGAAHQQRLESFVRYSLARDRAVAQRTVRSHRPMRRRASLQSANAAINELAEQRSAAHLEAQR
jgi:hypothetical protein